MRLVANAVALVAPPRCAVCDRACDPRLALCERCEAELCAARPEAIAIAGTDLARAAAPYRGAARGLVAALKFRRLLTLADRAAASMAAAIGACDATLVPVPAAPLRRRARGFDPAEEIALALARRTGHALEPCLRRRQGPRQVGRPRADRLASPPRVLLRAPAPRHAVLVDDVITTGATIAACARALRGGGSQRVEAVAFAHSPRGFGMRPHPAYS